MLMLGAETIFVINPTLYGSKLAYDVKGFAPITGLVRANQALLAHPSFAPNTVGELISLAKQKPGEISYATSGIGSAPHVNIALLESMAGVKLLPVHYRGAAPALNDVVAGHVQLLSVAVSSALQPWRSGLVKMLGIGSPKRLPQMQDVPTVAESGLPGYEAVTWFGLFTTAGTPRDVVGKINAEVQQTVRRCGVPRAFHRPLHVRDHDDVAGRVRRFPAGRDATLGQGAARRQYESGLAHAARIRARRRSHSPLLHVIAIASPAANAHHTPIGSAR